MSEFLEKLSVYCVLVGSVAREDESPNDVDLVFSRNDIDRVRNALAASEWEWKEGVNGFAAWMPDGPKFDIMPREKVEGASTAELYGVTFRSNPVHVESSAEKFRYVSWAHAGVQRTAALRLTDGVEVVSVRETGKERPTPARTNKNRGPGGKMKALLHDRFGLKGCSACGETVALMNYLGARGCRKWKRVILEDIWDRRDQLKGWRGLAAKLPGAKVAALKVLGELYDEASS